MKRLLFLSSVVLVIFCACTTSAKVNGSTTYKGRLQVKALCMNYTLSVIEGAIDTSLVNASWTDETTGKSYQQAFGLAKPCNFPGNIKEGDEFYFVIDTAKGKDCAVCMAYYPTPPRKLSIKVVEK
jgi:hypothetical protein